MNARFHFKKSIFLGLIVLSSTLHFVSFHGGSSSIDTMLADQGNPSETSTSSMQDPHPVAGSWTGAIHLPGVELEIHVHLENPDDWRGQIDIPIQQLRGFSLGSIEVNGSAVSFVMPRLPGDPSFKGQIQNGIFTGDFTQNGKTFPFHLERGAPIEVPGATPGKGIPGQGASGIWQGSLEVNLFELRLIFHLEETVGEVKGTMDSIDQQARGIPISKGRLEGRQLRLELASIRGRFEGRMRPDGSAIEGEWSQGAKTFPLKIMRLSQAPDIRRPQEPRPPFPYRTEEVVFPNEAASIRLAGTLTLPQEEGLHPAVVLISGSGPQDRDEAIMGHKPFLVLADHLTRHGIAVLRFDDRGVGASEGNFASALTTDFAEDVRAAVAYLKTHKAIDARRIGLVGHSEGGLIAPMVAVDTDSVAYMVLLAGVGVPMPELLARQSADLIRVMGADEEKIAEQAKIQGRIFDLILNGQTGSDLKAPIRGLLKESQEGLTPEQLEAMGATDDHIESQLDMLTSPWFRKLLTIDPTPTLEQVSVPVLAMNGKKDLQVACDENLQAIGAALRRGGNQEVTLRAFEDLNHLFQTCKTGAIAEYGTIEETFNEEALNTVSTWIRKVSGLDGSAQAVPGSF